MKYQAWMMDEQGWPIISSVKHISVHNLRHTTARWVNLVDPTHQRHF